MNYAKAIDTLANDLAKRLAESYRLGHTNLFKGWPSVYQTNKYYFKPEPLRKPNIQASAFGGQFGIGLGDLDFQIFGVIL